MERKTVSTSMRILLYLLLMKYTVNLILVQLFSDSMSKYIGGAYTK